MFFFDFTSDLQAVLNQFWWQINFLLLVIFVILGYLAIKKPIWAVCLTIVLLPTYLFRSKIGFLPFTFLELCLLVTFFGWLIYRSKKQEARIKNLKSLLPTPYSLLPILLVLIASAISVFTAPSLSAAAGVWKAYFIEPILFFIVLSDLLKEKENREKILWALGISTLAVSLLAIYQKFTAFGIAQPAWIDPAHRRVTSFFTSPNAVGLYLGPIVLIYLGWLVEGIKKQEARSKNIFRGLIILLSLIAIVFTVSQGTWLGLLAGLIFFVFFAFPPRQKKRQTRFNLGWIRAMVIMAVILSLIISFALPAIRQAIWPIITFQDQSGQNRLRLWSMAKDYLSAGPKNFILGAGLGGFAQIENRLRDPFKLEALLYPHNIFLNFWLETGLLGLIGFAWLIVLFFKKGFSSPRAEGAIRESRLLQYGLMAAMVAVIVHGLIDVPYFKNDLAVLFWLIIGLL